MSVRTEWRSLLFVPADQPHRAEKAARCGPDAVILDLEDSVAPAAKAQAREALPAMIEALRQAGVQALVRINAGAPQADLEAAVGPGVCALVVPKAESRAALDALSPRLAALERAGAMTVGAIGLLALIESPAALLAAAQIAAADRILGLALGGEDFAVALGAPSSAASLDLPCTLIALNAAAAGVAGLGLPFSLAEFRDLEGYAQAAREARAIGLTGVLCIHPAQVPIINAAFAPTPDQRARALRLIAAWEAAVADGRAVVAFEGAMVDAPVVEAARALLARSPD